MSDESAERGMDEVTEIYIKNLIAFVRLGESYETFRIGVPVGLVSEAIHATRWYQDKRWCNSTAAKKVNRVMSRGAALELEKLSSPKAFADGTTLEHPNEKQRMYSELLRGGPVITRDDVINVLGRYPLVTVTKAEDGKLGRTGGPERYERGEVKVGIVPEVAPHAPASSWTSLAEAGLARLWGEGRN